MVTGHALREGQESGERIGAENFHDSRRIGEARAGQKVRNAPPGSTGRF